MSLNMDAARQAFIEEVAELLQSMEDALLALEDNPADNESLNEVFRAMHTIKGTGGVFGYMPVVEFTHAVESVMEEVRSGREPMSEQLICILFACRDHTSRLIEAIVEMGEDSGKPLSSDLIATGHDLLKQLTQRTLQTTNITPNTPEQPKYLPIVSDVWMIALDFGRNALRNGMDPLSFLRYLGSLGDIVDVVTLSVPPPLNEEFDPESCYLSFRIAFRSDADKPTIAAVFEFAEDDCDIRILPPDSAQDTYLDLLASLSDTQVTRIGEMLVSIGALTPNELARALAHQADERNTDAISETHSEHTANQRLGDILIQQGSIKPAVLEQAAKTQEAARAKRQDETRFIRVDAERLGHLINLVGELVTSSAAIRIMVERAGVENMNEVVDSVDYLVAEIRDNALQLRMVPIGESLSRFRRVVRDTSKELGKNIELVITGGDTELDKTVVEKITDPFMHLIRNAVDHGIESPEERARVGKPVNGTITVNAYHDSGHIVIEIEDDGAGLDVKRIRAKAEAKGLVKPEDTLSHEETLRLIFAPGLSTKDSATNLSGRGVGMDVVRQNIEALRGSVELDSVLGQGTKITIILPLTLAIIDGFLVGAGRDQYVIPLSQVAECVEMKAAGEMLKPHNGHYINLRGEVLPFIRLTELFNNQHTVRHEHRESLVVVRFGHHKVGLVVDTLLGELQTVIKPLGKLFEELRGIAGATILGTGDIALILDVSELAMIGQMKRHHSDLRHS
ncbi:chemotaxis protein CheA [Rhodoferax sp. 4810]|uniref:Chemotaxis protein CheA n=1 Tax=Thiospirillum jenense TaxID=1653858 RepID=A0A839H3T2_9GAMM|nr:chemotaxis protein CheA [Thiospirillum jenense]MBB1076302.1 chemotaxis protein CheA [Rhodoferax jenense]MBB1124895.1 chemotaxis protein CheA [Thiospirillum jenense]